MENFETISLKNDILDWLPPCEIKNSKSIDSPIIMQGLSLLYLYKISNYRPEQLTDFVTFFQDDMTNICTTNFSGLRKSEIIGIHKKYVESGFRCIYSKEEDVCTAFKECVTLITDYSKQYSPDIIQKISHRKKRRIFEKYKKEQLRKYLSYEKFVLRRIYQKNVSLTNDMPCRIIDLLLKCAYKKIYLLIKDQKYDTND
jgi:hypothetical protein